MASPPVNQKTFKLTNRISKSFDLVIDNFSYATTLLMNILFKLRITFSPTFSIAFLTNINLRKIKLIISQVKLSVSITQTINAKKVRIVYVARERIKALVTILSINRISFISKVIQKLFSTIVIKKIQIIATPILAQFFTLGYFDPQTLGTLDVLTLGEMDYTT